MNEQPTRRVPETREEAYDLLMTTQNLSTYQWQAISTLIGIEQTHIGSGEAGFPSKVEGRGKKKPDGAKFSAATLYKKTV